MTGQYYFEVQTKHLKYSFTLYRNITIICGDSGTGKTTLMELLADAQTGDDNSVQVTTTCKGGYVVLEGNMNKQLFYTILKSCKNQVVFMDEGVRNIKDDEFAAELQAADCYTVIVSREQYMNLPYSYKEIYELKTSGKYVNGVPKFETEFVRSINLNGLSTQTHLDTIITEDAKAGNDFFKKTVKDVEVKSAEGNGNIAGIITKEDVGKKVLVIADGAAIGPHIKSILAVMRKRHNCALFLPESFEYLILKSGVIKECNLDKILEQTWEYADSKEYLSWERYYTALLEGITSGTIAAYKKSSINKFYLRDGIKQKILRLVPIRLEVNE